jgi:hypothetical protein
MRRTYDFQKHCCSVCGILTPFKDFKHHTEAECFVIELKKKENLESLINIIGGKNNEMSAV